MLTAKPFLLRCSPQHYSWGKSASTSLVAKLCRQTSGEGPFAELWMGAHPKAPALAVVEGQEFPLDRLVETYPSYILGKEAAERWGQVPFLFKVLSIARPLSIQLHPNKVEAKKLHALRPQEYPDENHKPEIAIALTPVELLYGVKSRAELLDTLQKYPELAALVPEVRRGTSKEIFEAVLSADAARLKTSTEALSRRLKTGFSLSAPERWFMDAQQHFGAADRGLWCFFLMHLETIPTGQALFTQSHVPHAYLSGDLVECMANSDNVVRAGLTDKFQDLPALFGLIDYTVAAPTFLKAEVCGPGGCEHFGPGLDEFCVDRFSKPGRYPLQLSTVGILLCLNGQGSLEYSNEQTSIGEGDVLLLPAALGSCVLNIIQGQFFLASVPA